MISEVDKKQNLKPGACFHEPLAESWSGNYQRGGFLRRVEFVDSLLDIVVSPGAQWLDLGCGSGVLTRRLEALGAGGAAVDGSPAMIEVARQAAGDRSRNEFEYRWIETVESLDYADASFDGVLCSSVIEYVETPAAVLDEMARVLKPGGTLIASFANSRSPVRLFQHVARVPQRFFAKKIFTYLDASRSTFTRDLLEKELAKRAFAVNAMKGFDPILPIWLIRIAPGMGTLIFVTATKN